MNADRREVRALGGRIVVHALDRRAEPEADAVALEARLHDGGGVLISRGRMRGPRSKTVTLEPKRAKACAISTR